MDKKQLKQLRFVIPGALFYVFYLILGYVSGLWDVSLPENWQEAAYGTAPIVLGFLYYSLPLRNWANRPFAVEVHSRLTRGLAQQAGAPYTNREYEWEQVSGVFWHFIDKDPSLKSKSLDAYFNGLIWTTWSDVRAISLVYVILSSVILLISCPAGSYAVLLFSSLFLISFLGSHFVTQRHHQIGEEQLRIIGTKFKKELRDLLEAVDE